MNQQEFEQLMQKEGFETVVVERPANGETHLAYAGVCTPSVVK